MIKSLLYLVLIALCFALILAKPTMFDSMCPMWSCNTERAYP